MSLHTSRNPEHVAKGPWCLSRGKGLVPWSATRRQSTVYWTAEDFDRIRDLAIANGINFSEQVRRLCKEALNG